MTITTLGTLRHACAQCGGSCQGVNVGLANQEELERIHEQARELGIADPAPDGILRRSLGRCVFLGEDELCRIHATWGLKAKPMVCRQYPVIAIRVVKETRVGIDPGCFHSVKTWRTGPETPGGRLISSVSKMPDAVLPHEERVMALLDQAEDVACALERLIPGQLGPFQERWLRVLQEMDLTRLLADPETAPALRHSLGPMAAALPTWQGVPEDARLSDHAAAFALHATRRMVWLRLCPKIPDPAVVALLCLGGAMACAWTDPEDAVFGQAMAGWLRAIRASVVLGSLLPSPDTLKELIGR